MEHELNLNTVKRPTLKLMLTDEEKTTLYVRMPTLEMYKEMQDLSEQWSKGVEDDSDTVDELYRFIARVISHNRDGIKVTPDELKGKYNIDLETLLIVYKAYIKFLAANTNAKN